MTTLAIDRDIATELRPDLDKDEKLLWIGRPRTGIIFRSSDIFVIPFSLVWGGFFIYWESTVLVMNSPFFLKLWGIPFLFVGLYVIVGRFFIDAKSRSKTIYGITDNRIIIKSGIFNKEIRSVNIKSLSDLTVSEKADGTGTILLGPKNRGYNMQGMGWSGSQQTPRLDLIPDVRKVYETILKLQKQV